MKQIPEISDECTSAFKKLSTLNIQNCQDFDALAKSVGYTDESFVNFLKDTSYSEKTLDNYQKYIQSATTATSAFSATLKSIAANIAIMLLINGAIKLAEKAWDKFNTTVEESQSTLSETQSTISDLKAKITELNAIPDNELTQGQRDKLENLQQQLATQEKLEEIEQRRLARETIGNGNFADYFDKDSYKGAIGDIVENSGKSINDSYRWINEYKNIGNKIKNIQSDIESTKSLNKNGVYDKYLTTLDNKLDNAFNRQKERSAKLEEIQADLLSQQEKLQGWKETIQSYKDDGYLVGSDLDVANQELDEIDQYLQNIQTHINDINDTIYSGTGEDWKTQLASKTKYSLKNLYDEGFTDEDLSVLATLEFDKNASLNELRDLLNKGQQEADENPITVITTLSDALTNIGTGDVDPETGEFTSNLGTDLSNYQSEIKSIQDAIKGLDNGSVSLIDLATNFGIVGDSVADCKRQLDDLAQAKMQEMKNEIDSIIQGNGLSPEVVRYLEQLRDSLNDVYDASKKFSGISLTGNILDDVQQLSEGFEQLDKIYADILDGDTFDWSSILNNEEFEETFGNLGEVYDDFIETVSQNPDNISACQSAFDNLTNAYLYQSGVLDELDESHANTVISMLQEQGIANADAIVMNALAAQKLYAAQTGKNLADATYEEIIQFANEGSTADSTRQYLINYVIAKANANGTTIDTSGDIQNLNDLIAALEAAGLLINTFKVGGAQKNTRTQENQSNSVTTDVGADTNTAQDLPIPSYTPPQFTGGSATNKAREDAAKGATKGAKDAEDEAKKAAEEMEKSLTDALTRIQDAIDELDKEASDKYSKWSTRNDALNAEMGKVQEAIGAQQALVDFYNSQGDATKAQQAANAIKDLQRQLKELANQKLENIKKFNEDIIALTESLKDLTQSYIDIKEARGIAFSESDYVELISKSEEERKQYETELSQLQAQLQENIDNGYLEEGSEAWYEWQKELNVIKKSINECTKEQIEWNKAIKKMPLEAIEKYVNAANRITSLLNAQQDILNARGIGENLHNISAHLMNITNDIGNAQGQIREYEKLIRDGFSDDVNGWAKLTEEQVNQVMSYITDGWDEAGMTTYLASLGVDASRLTELDEYIQKLGDAETALLTAKKEQVEWNKAIQELQITGAEKYGVLIEKMNSEISDQNSILDARGLSKSAEDIKNELHGVASTAMIEQNKINNYYDVIRKNLTDDVNGWANLTENQVDEVFQYIASNDQQGLFDLFNGIGINPATLDQFWELIGDIETANSNIQSATASQIELNKAFEQLKIQVYDNLNELLEKTKTEIEGLRSLIESHGNYASDNLLNKQIDSGMKAIDLYKGKITEYNNYIRSMFSDSVTGWADLTKEQIDKIFTYLNSNDTQGLEKYFNSLGLTSGTLTEFWEVVGNIRNEENNILSEMVNQEGYFDDMLENRITQLDKIKEELQKINDAKNKALELEKARYALIEAENNRNVMTWDGNQMVWTQDNDKVSDALENLNNLEFQALIDSIDEATDAIRDLMDSTNLYDDNGNLLSNWQDIISTAQNSVSDIITGVISKLNERGYDIDVPKFGTGGVIKGKQGDNNLIRVADKERVLTPAQNDIYEKFLNYVMKNNYNPFTGTSLTGNMLPNNIAKANYDIVRKNDNSNPVVYEFNGDIIAPNVHDGDGLNVLVKDLESITVKAEQRMNRI